MKSQTNITVQDQDGNSSKPLLPAVLSDSEYINELEGLVCFLAGCYEDTKEIYFDKHLRTCSSINPNKRDLTDAEQSEWQRFPMIQGTRLQNIIKVISKSNKPRPTNIKGLLERLTA